MSTLCVNLCVCLSVTGSPQSVLLYFNKINFIPVLCMHVKDHVGYHNKFC